jgi:hypothetical protein
MAFIVPTFNLTCNIWSRATWGATSPTPIPPPDYPNVPCQLRADMKAQGNVYLFDFLWQAEYLLVPAGTDLRIPDYATNIDFDSPDIVEVPSGSSRWYFLVYTFDVAKGFSNEYRVGVLISTQGARSGRYSTMANYPFTPPWVTPYP